MCQGPPRIGMMLALLVSACATATSRPNVLTKVAERFPGVDLANVKDMQALAKAIHARMLPADCDVEVEVESAGQAAAVVAILEERCSDDSVQARRTIIDFSRNAGGAYDAVNAEEEWRCWPKRGHTDFGTGPCL